MKCEICQKDIESDTEVEVRLTETTGSYVNFNVHDRCIVGMGVVARRLLKELRTQSE